MEGIGALIVLLGVIYGIFLFFFPIMIYNRVKDIREDTRLTAHYAKVSADALWAMSAAVQEEARERKLAQSKVMSESEDRPPE
jgi:hypothetical protein